MAPDNTISIFLEQAKRLLAEPWRPEYYLDAHLAELEQKKVEGLQSWKTGPTTLLGIYRSNSRVNILPASEVLVPPAVFARLWALTAQGHAPHDLCAEGSVGGNGKVGMDLTFRYNGRKYSVLPHPEIKRACLR